MIIMHLSMSSFISNDATLPVCLASHVNRLRSKLLTLGLGFNHPGRHDPSHDAQCLSQRDRTPSWPWGVFL